MTRANATVAIAAIMLLISPAASLAQDATAGVPNVGPTGTRNSSKQALPPAPGTNSAGTALSSGAGVNTAPGVTTGAAGTGTMSTTSQSSDAAINEENKTIDRKLKSICRGC